MSKFNPAKPKNVASLVYFSDNVEKERAVKWLEKLKNQGHIKSHVTHEYDEQFGEPVWYIP